MLLALTGVILLLLLVVLVRIVGHLRSSDQDADDSSPVSEWTADPVTTEDTITDTGVLSGESDFSETETETDTETATETEAVTTEAPVTTAPNVADNDPLAAYWNGSSVDFDKLKKINPDIYAWLSIPGTGVSYPILQRAGDDSFYLNHDMYGNESKYGAVYSQSEYNANDFSDMGTVLYGHRVNSYDMFGQLQTIYSDAATFGLYPDIYIYMPDQTLHFTIFAAVPYDDRHILYNYDFDNAYWYDKFLDSIYAVRRFGANFNQDIEVSTDDKLLVLSTCLQGTTGGDRFLVLATLQD